MGDRDGRRRRGRADGRGSAASSANVEEMSSSALGSSGSSTAGNAAAGSGTPRRRVPRRRGVAHRGRRLGDPRALHRPGHLPDDLAGNVVVAANRDDGRLRGRRPRDQHGPRRGFRKPAARRARLHLGCHGHHHQRIREPCAAAAGRRRSGPGAPATRGAGHATRRPRRPVRPRRRSTSSASSTESANDRAAEPLPLGSGASPPLLPTTRQRGAGRSRRASGIETSSMAVSAAELESPLLVRSSDTLVTLPSTAHRALARHSNRVSCGHMPVRAWAGAEREQPRAPRGSWTPRHPNRRMPGRAERETVRASRLNESAIAKRT